MKSPKPPPSPPRIIFRCCHLSSHHLCHLRALWKRTIIGITGPNRPRRKKTTEENCMHVQNWENIVADVFHKMYVKCSFFFESLRVFFGFKHQNQTHSTRLMRYPMCKSPPQVFHPSVADRIGVLTTSFWRSISLRWTRNMMSFGWRELKLKYGYLSLNIRCVDDKQGFYVKPQ